MFASVILTYFICFHSFYTTVLCSLLCSVHHVYQAVLVSRSERFQEVHQLMRMAFMGIHMQPYCVMPVSTQYCSSSLLWKCDLKVLLVVQHS